MSTRDSTTPGPGDAKGDPRALRRAFGAFMTGVTIVATRDAAGAPRGFTANSFTSVSLDPPLLLICLGRNASSRPVFEAAGGFTVSVLAEDQQRAANVFAGPSEDRFAEVAWRDGALGRPIIEGAAAWFDCATERRIDAGDHMILIGRVERFDSTEANGLGYARGGYFTLGLSQQAMRAAGSTAPYRVGAVVERPDAAEGDGLGEIFLESDGAGGWRPPLADVAPSDDAAETLRRRLDALGLEATLGPLYAVFTSARTGVEHVYYRAASGGRAPGSGRFFALEALPFEAIEGEALKSMLRRYVEEHRGRRFNIVYGDRSGGAD